jgi:protein arginine N-methyltransferase 1
MNPLLRRSLELAQKLVRRAKEKAGMVSGFSHLETHLWMLADRARTKALERAIGAAVRTGSIVVDVGAGTGLLSMLACRAGAAKVYAIEETEIIGLAKEIIRNNGYDDRVTFLQGNSKKIDLPERADVVVSETIGAFAFSEEILSTLVDARRRFLKPTGHLVPEGIRVFVAPIESFLEGTGFWEEPVAGFDFRSAIPRMPAGVMTAARKIDHRHFLGEERVLYDVDFRKADPEMDFSRTIEFTAGRQGTLHGFVGFWEAHLFGEITIECRPGGHPVHWPPVLFRLPAGIPTEEGDRIVLSFGRKDRPGWHWRWDARVHRGDPATRPA